MHLPAIPVILLCLAIGLVVGLRQGDWISYVRIPPFITTLSGMFIFRSLGRMVLNSKTVAIQDPTFLNIFTAYIKIPGLDDGKIKLSPIIVGVAAAAWVLLNTAKTAFGRYFYAVGGNEKATKLSGINTDKIYFIAYANMGLLAGLCGLLGPPGWGR